MGKDIHTKEIGWMERLAERENIHTYVTIKYAMLRKANLKMIS